MIDHRIIAYDLTVDHTERLRQSEYARLAQALDARQPTGFNLYRVVGERLTSWGEALQRANAHREAFAQPDRRVRTGELPAV